MGSRGAQAPALFSAPRRRSSGRCSAPVPARPPFALDRLREIDPDHLLYASTKQGPGGNGPQLLTPLELLDRLAALVPPPRIHRHRYFGVLAPNSALRTAVTALAPGATTALPAPMAVPAAEPAHRRAVGYAWAMLIARIYEVFPLRCTHWRPPAPNTSRPPISRSRPSRPTSSTSALLGSHHRRAPSAPDAGRARVGGRQGRAAATPVTLARETTAPRRCPNVPSPRPLGRPSS